MPWAILLLGLLLGLGFAQGLVLEDDLVQALELAPGQEASLALSLRNEGSRALRVRVEVVDYEEGRGFLPPGTLPRSLAPHLALATSEVRVPPGGRASLRLTLRAPADLRGTRYAYLLLTPEEAAGGPGQGGSEVAVGLQLVQRYAVLLLASHGGEPQVRFQRGWVEEGRLFLQGENLGDRYYRPHVRYQVVGAGGVVAERELGTYTFLPGNPKTLALPLPKLEPGSYQVLVFLDDGVKAYAVRSRLDLR